VATDPLDMVLRLVAEGRLTADEAAPILAALDVAPAGAAPSSSRGSAGPAAAGTADGEGEPGTGRSLRIEVRDAGRTVVNLRLPLALGRFALDRIPGLSGDQVDRVRAALNSGMTGPVLVVDDDGDSVRIAID
jgi:SHOCT-like domain